MTGTTQKVLGVEQSPGLSDTIFKAAIKNVLNYVTVKQGAKNLLDREMKLPGVKSAAFGQCS